MKCYVVTKLAGEHVAGRRSPGAGGILLLTKEQAEQPLRLGYLRETPEEENEPRRKRRNGRG